MTEEERNLLNELVWTAKHGNGDVRRAIRRILEYTASHARTLVRQRAYKYAIEEIDDYIRAWAPHGR